MPDAEDVLSKTVSVLKNMVDRGQGGVTYTSDQITYPSDLDNVEDALTRRQTVAYIYKDGSFYEDDAITFMLHGEFRAYEQLVEGDPNSITTPIMANVYVDLERSKKAGLTELEIHFNALHAAYGPDEDPRIRFVCDGRYDPAGSGDTRFRVVLEVDQNANVTVVESQVTGGDGVLHDSSPNGFSLTVEE